MEFSAYFGFFAFAVATNFRDIPLDSAVILSNRVNGKNFLSGYHQTDLVPITDRALLLTGKLSEPSFVEQIPVEHRLQVLHELRGITARKCIFHSSRSDRRNFTRKQKRYAQYLESFLYAEIGVLRMLARYAYSVPQRGEHHIMSVDDVISHLRKTFKKHQNYSLEYLTPKMVSKWYELLYSQWYSDLRSSKMLNETHLVHLRVSEWHQEIIEPRIEQLLRSGYEEL